MKIITNEIREAIGALMADQGVSVRGLAKIAVVCAGRRWPVGVPS